MSVDRVVVNASPLIVLFKSGQADLLPKLFREIIVPQTVWQEVTVSKNDAAAQQLSVAPWVTLVQVEVDAAIAGWDLGAGESAVLSYAWQNPNYRAMVDDATARRCAQTFGIATLGTGGAIVLAKQRGLISSVGDCLRHLQNAGLWLSEDVIALLKQQGNE